MKLFNARIGEATGTLVIARSGSHAAEIFITHHIAKHGEGPAGFTISQCDLREIPLLDDLRELVRGRTSGMVEFDDETGYSLIPM